MINFDRVWYKICNDYVEDYGNISYRIAEKGHGCSNKPKTLYIEISAEDYDDNIIGQPFTAIRDWLWSQSNTQELRHDGEIHHFDDFDVVIDVID